jgi:hypothetical protein
LIAGKERKLTFVAPNECGRKPNRWRRGNYMAKKVSSAVEIDYQLDEHPIAQPDAKPIEQLLKGSLGVA